MRQFVLIGGMLAALCAACVQEEAVSLEPSDAQATGGDSGTGGDDALPDDASGGATSNTGGSDIEDEVDSDLPSVSGPRPDSGEDSEEDEPDPGEADLIVDNDNDGYRPTDREGRVFDCNDDDETVNPDAREVCDGLDNNCNEQTDEGCESEPIPPDPRPESPPEQEPEAPNQHLLVIEVGQLENAAAFDFSYGYCSEVLRGQDCRAWNRSVARVLWANSIRYSVIVYETGWLRFNSSFFMQSEDVSGDRIVGVADRWLCEGSENPMLTTRVNVWLDGELCPPGIVVPVAIDDGCSGAINVSALFDP